MFAVTIVGAGVIGQSWARLFADHGWRVTISDPRDDLREVIASTDLATTDIHVDADVESAVATADLVQECGPERVGLKQALFARFAAAAPSTAVFASSTSSLLPSDIAEGNAAAERILVAHPFNPPHLMPLVELVPGRETSDATMAWAQRTYASIGKVPVRLKREIRGFVGNRLQKALNLEATYLVAQDFIDPAGLDTVITNSLGLRWATVGPFESRHLGGGPGGIRHLAHNVGSQMDFPLGRPEPDLMENVYTDVERAYGTDEQTNRQRARRRDRLTEKILAARADDTYPGEPRTGDESFCDSLH